MRPVDVNEDNEDDLYHSVYSKSKESLNKFKYKINDMVRILDRICEKFLRKGWSEEIFYVSELLARSTYAYKISDQMNEPVEGIFYESELLKNYSNASQADYENKSKTNFKTKLKLPVYLEGNYVIA
jgi:hypothetical protein